MHVQAAQINAEPYSWPHDSSLSKETTALVVIDMQRDSDLPSREVYRSKNNASSLGIGDVGPLGRLLIRGETGHDIIRELYPQEAEPIIDKPGKSAFANTDFDLLLKVNRIKNLIICGVTTDVCVHSTMRDADDRGYDCLLVEDACAASTEDLHRFTVLLTKAQGGVFGAVASVSDVLGAMNGTSQAELHRNKTQQQQ
ncbi:putative isochorismatase [Septoria linicola]|nr:putative isochorismatase [Septoria linicola]